MKTRMLLAAIGMMSLASVTSAEKPRGGRIEWKSDLQAALDAAGRERRPVMVYFTHDC